MPDCIALPHNARTLTRLIHYNLRLWKRFNKSFYELCFRQGYSVQGFDDITHSELGAVMEPLYLTDNTRANIYDVCRLQRPGKPSAVSSPGNLSALCGTRGNVEPRGIGVS